MARKPDRVWRPCSNAEVSGAARATCFSSIYYYRLLMVIMYRIWKNTKINNVKYVYGTKR